MKVEIEVSHGWRMANVNSRNLKEAVALVNRKELDVVVINPHVNNANSELLKAFTNLRGIFLTDLSKLDLKSIYLFPALEWLTLGDNRKDAVDFRFFPSLKVLSTDLLTKDILPENKSLLQSLHLWSYDSKPRDLSELPNYQHLNELELVSSKIQKLDGIERLHKLTSLEMHYCQSLNSISPLKKSSVKTLLFANCAKITDWQELGGLKSLEKLSILDCKEMQSISVVRDCPNLKEFRFFGTRVLDGDLSPLLGRNWRHLDFTSSRSYSHTKKEIEESCKS
jgi:hypothetical protein